MQIILDWTLHVGFVVFIAPRLPPSCDSVALKQGSTIIRETYRYNYDDQHQEVLSSDADIDSL